MHTIRNKKAGNGGVKVVEAVCSLGSAFVALNSGELKVHKEPSGVEDCVWSRSGSVT